jgi:hypothetical protein
MSERHTWQQPSPEVADLRRDSAAYRTDLNHRLGLASVSGAEERSRIVDGRGLTAVELREALCAYRATCQLKRSVLLGLPLVPAQFGD